MVGCLINNKCTIINNITNKNIIIDYHKIKLRKNHKR